MGNESHILKVLIYFSEVSVSLKLLTGAFLDELCEEYYNQRDSNAFKRLKEYIEEDFNYYDKRVKENEKR